MMKFFSRKNLEKEDILIKNKENIPICMIELESKIINIYKKNLELKLKALNISFSNFIKENRQEKINDIYAIIQELFEVSIQGIEFKLSYDINNIFVNLNKEDIIQVIYNKYIENQSFNINISIEDFEDIILEKISLVLPQDLILLLQYNEFRQQYNNIKDKIISFYKKGEHLNLINFIKTMKYHKNIIYSFSKIDERLLLDINNNIKTNILGEINKNNIKEININSMISENKFNIELDNFYSNKDNLIIIIKVDPKCIDLKKYINLINLSIENNDNEKKVFIITVHINRIFEEEIKDVNENESINYNNFNYSDYYHIFIDNLNDKKYISLEEKIKIKENINMEDIIIKFFVNQINKTAEDIIFKSTNILLKCIKINDKLYPVFSVLFKKIINNSPKCILNNLECIKNCNKLYINLINNYKNEVLNEIILKVFENYFILYFESITNLSKEEIELNFPKYFEGYKNNNKINPTFILLDKSFELFKKCINFLDDIYKKTFKNDKDVINNELLCKLYCISYIKIYLFKTISLNFDNYENIDEIIRVLEGNENNNFRKILKFMFSKYISIY